MFSVLTAKIQLPHINTTATSNEIANWKSTIVIGECYRRLFLPLVQNSKMSLMTNIIGKFWGNEEQSITLTAMVISVWTIILNPKIQKIEVSEDILAPKIVKNMISFIFFS